MVVGALSTIPPQIPTVGLIVLTCDGRWCQVWTMGGGRWALGDSSSFAPLATAAEDCLARKKCSLVGSGDDHWGQRGDFELSAWWF